MWQEVDAVIQRHGTESHHRPSWCGGTAPIAAPEKFEVKRLGAVEYRNNGMTVSSSSYSASNFAGAALIILDAVYEE